MWQLRQTRHECVCQTLLRVGNLKQTGNTVREGGRGWVILALPSLHRFILNISIVHNTSNNKLNKNTNSLSESVLLPHSDSSPSSHSASSPSLRSQPLNPQSSDSVLQFSDYAPPCCWITLHNPPLYHRVFVVVVMVVLVHAATQHRVVDGRRRPVRALRRRPVDVLLPLAAQDLPEGGAHLLVPVGVDDGVHG